MPLFKDGLFSFFQIYEKKIKQFRKSLDNVQPSLDASLTKRPRLLTGADTVCNDLDLLNRRYMELLAELNHRLRQLKHLHDSAGLYFPVSQIGFSYLITILWQLYRQNSLNIRNTPLFISLASYSPRI